MMLFEFMLILPILFYWINKSYEALINTILLPKTNWLHAVPFIRNAL